MKAGSRFIILLILASTSWCYADELTPRIQVWVGRNAFLAEPNSGWRLVEKSAGGVPADSGEKGEISELRQNELSAALKCLNDQVCGDIDRDVVFGQSDSTNLADVAEACSLKKLSAHVYILYKQNTQSRLAVVIDLESGKVVSPKGRITSISVSVESRQIAFSKCERSEYVCDVSIIDFDGVDVAAPIKVNAHVEDVWLRGSHASMFVLAKRKLNNAGWFDGVVEALGHPITRESWHLIEIGGADVGAREILISNELKDAWGSFPDQWSLQSVQ